MCLLFTAMNESTIYAHCTSLSGGFSDRVLDVGLLWCLALLKLSLGHWITVLIDIRHDIGFCDLLGDCTHCAVNDARDCDCCKLQTPQKEKDLKTIKKLSVQVLGERLG